MPSPIKEKRSKHPRSAKAAEAPREPPVLSDCELILKPVDNVSKIGVIHENSARGKCGYEACWTGLKSTCPSVNDFIDEFAGRIKKVVAEYEEGDPIFFKPRGKERRMIPLDHHSLFKDVQAFLDHKKGTKMKKEAWFSSEHCCFLAKCYQKTIFVYSDPLAGTKTRRSTKLEESFQVTTTVYFHRKDGKVHVELLKEGIAYPTKGALCLHHQLFHWQWLETRGQIYSVIQECPAKGEAKKAQGGKKPSPAAKADETQTMETTSGRPGASADTFEKPEARDSSAAVAKMLEPTNEQPGTTAGTTEEPEVPETLEATNEKPAATVGTMKKSEVQDTSTDVAKMPDATSDKTAGTEDTDDAPGGASNLAKSKGGSGFDETGITPPVKSRVRKEKTRVCLVWAREGDGKELQPGFLIDDHDNNGPDGLLIEWASTGQMVRLPFHQLTFKLAPRVRVPVTRPGTTARAKRSSESDEEADEDADEERRTTFPTALKGRFVEHQQVFYTDPDGEGGEVFASIFQVHDDEYTITLADGKVETVLESTLSPLPAGVDYLSMSEIERESFLYERFKSFQQRQIMMRADGDKGSRKSKKARASLANVSPLDQSGHEGDLADNRLPTLSVPATSLNVDTIKQQLQAAEKVHEANAKKYNRLRAKFRASKKDVDALKRMLEEAEGKSDNSNVAIQPLPNLHDQRCYYRPFCMRMSRDCGGWTRTGCEDFKPKDKYGREGPRRKELPGGTDGAVFRKRKRLFDAPKLRETSKKSMRKKRELERQGGKK